MIAAGKWKAVVGATKASADVAGCMCTLVVIGNVEMLEDDRDHSHSRSAFQVLH